MQVVSIAARWRRRQCGRRRRRRRRGLGAATWALLPHALIVVAFLLVGVAAHLVAPYDPREVEFGSRLLPPLSEGHVLGTDPLGRDLLSRIIHGTRISLLVGTCASLVSGAAGVVLGLVSGYHGGLLDDVIMRLADIQLGFPQFLLALAIMAVMGAGLLNVILALSISGWVTYARIVRSQVLSIKQMEFVEAARSLGIPKWRIMARHILPNCVAQLLIIGTFHFASCILSETSLSFLGLGVDPETPSWGSILAEGRGYMREQWWVTTWPGLAIMAVVLSLNTIGDWLRDRLDPRLKGGG